MPTVKTMTFRQGGHHATCAERRKYLEADERQIDCICVNVSNPERWDKELDRTREQYHLRGCVNYREYIISPDVKDAATACQVRNLAMQWVKENFPNAEAVIVLHDDNKERLASGKQGITHAHVVVNSVDLDTGRKVVIKDAKVRDLHNSLQHIAADLGLSVQPDYKPGERLQSAQLRQRSQAERRLELRGIKSWKSQVRDMALQAAELSTTPTEFKECLDRADVDVVVDRGRIYLADRENPTRACRSDRLDRMLSTDELAKRFLSNAYTVNDLNELRALANSLKMELAQGDNMRLQMQRYDHRCRKAITAYEKAAVSHKGESLQEFPEFRMPATRNQAEKTRAAQTCQAFRCRADAVKREYARPVRQQNTTQYRTSNSSHSRTQATAQTHSRGLSR